MSRRGIIAGAILLAIFGAALPMAAMLYASWSRAVAQEQNRLEAFARRAIVRANKSLDEATGILHAMDRLKFNACSHEHLAQMRTATLNARAVREIGYFENGVLKCTSWGLTAAVIRQKAGDFTTSDGIQVTLRLNPVFSGGNAMMALHYRSHNVLIDPISFVDVIADPNMQLAITTDNGTQIAALNGPNPQMVAAAVARPGNGVTDEHLISSARSANWIAVAIAPRSEMLATLRGKQLLLLPFGALIAAGIVGIVIWISRRRLSPLGELKTAVQLREFVVHYQPIIELKSGRCIGAEALVRWRRADGTMVRPDLFIPLAEETGLIAAITDQVIDNVIADLNPALVSDRSLHIAINLSAEDIRTARVLPVLERALEYTGIEQRQIWLETTERGFTDIESARATIQQARELGYPVAIDDFGTGYSSLSHLQSLPLDTLKIDKSFIDSIGTDSATSSVTAHIISMAKALGLKIVAEGVETQAQADYLRGQDVDFAQGWAFSKPLPALDFIAFHHRNRDRQDWLKASNVQRIA